MTEELNISEILKGKSKGTKLYSPIFGDCTFSFIQGVTDAICVIANDNREFFNYKGLFSTLGEVMLFPSKLMRDWSKFAWKRGDVLQKNNRTQVIFDSFVSDTYEVIRCKYLLKVDNGNEEFVKETNVFTRDYFKVSEDQRQCYINKIEEHFGGKLNRETLEVEKAQPEFKNGDIITFNNRIILIYSTTMEVSLERTEIYYHACLKEGKLMVNGYLMSYGFKEGRSSSTEEERQQLFSALAKEGKAWNAEKKMIMELKPKVELKPFDKVLVRDTKYSEWQADFFSNIDEDNRFVCVGATWSFCIPYNEETAKLIGTTNNMEG